MLTGVCVSASYGADDFHKKEVLMMQLKNDCESSDYAKKNLFAKVSGAFLKRSSGNCFEMADKLRQVFAEGSE